MGRAVNGGISSRGKREGNDDYVQELRGVCRMNKSERGKGGEMVLNRCRAPSRRWVLVMCGRLRAIMRCVALGCAGSASARVVTWSGLDLSASAFVSKLQMIASTARLKSAGS